MLMWARVRQSCRVAMTSVLWLGLLPQFMPAQPQADSLPAQQPVVLDKVIAIINGDVLLQSDLQGEMDMAALQPLSVPPGQNTPQRAGRRLINRTLILQQMREQEFSDPISDEQLNQSIDELRKQLPACARYHCTTDEGWAAFLKEHNLTPEEVDARWRQRLQILAFIDLRFRAGMRIPQSEIADYYNKIFVPQFKTERVKPPSLASVSDRISEILLQQHVNGLLQEWLTSLRAQGSVQILDPQYGQSSGNPDQDNGGGT